MTTIVAVRDGKRTWIGSDTQWTGAGVSNFGEPKWVRFGQWAAGISGSLRTLNLVSGNAKRIFDDLDSPLEFTERLRATLKDYDYDIKAVNAGEAPTLDSSMILATPGRFWSICEELSISGHERFWAVGTGYLVALGAMSALDRFKTTKSEDMARIAIETAMQFDTGSGGEVWMDVLEA